MHVDTLNLCMHANVHAHLHAHACVCAHICACMPACRQRQRTGLPLACLSCGLQLACSLLRAYHSMFIVTGLSLHYFSLGCAWHDVASFCSSFLYRFAEMQPASLIGDSPRGAQRSADGTPASSSSLAISKSAGKHASSKGALASSSSHASSKGAPASSSSQLALGTRKRHRGELEWKEEEEEKCDEEENEEEEEKCDEEHVHSEEDGDTVDVGEQEALLRDPDLFATGRRGWCDAEILPGHRQLRPTPKHRR